MAVFTAPVARVLVGAVAPGIFFVINRLGRRLGRVFRVLVFFESAARVAVLEDLLIRLALGRLLGLALGRLLGLTDRFDLVSPRFPNSFSVNSPFLYPVF